MSPPPVNPGRQFFGKYRGKVENNLDPLQLGRLQVSVPAVLGEGTLSWAMPCAPFAGKVVELGKRHGIPTPVNETLFSIIRVLERKRD